MFKKLLALTLCMSALCTQSIHAANLNVGDVLTIDTGLPVFDTDGIQSDVISGSWFGFDTIYGKPGEISGYEKLVALSTGTTGLVIGVTTTPGASHAGCPVAGDSNSIDAPWCLNGNTGSSYIQGTPVTGGTDTGLDMRGWSVTYKGAPVPFLASAWGAGFSNGIGNFVWDGIYGHGYTLDLHAIACDEPSLCLNAGYYALHLEGTVVAVPEASTYGMMLAGLGLLIYVSRRHATTKKNQQGQATVSG